MTPRNLLSFLLLSLAFAPITLAQEIKPATVDDPAAAADSLYKSGKLDDAAKQYEALLTGDPKMFHARAGLMRIRLKQQRVDNAYELGKAGMAMPGFTAELIAEMGNVHFRRGEMGQAGDDYFHAERVDPKIVGAYLGLSRLYSAYSMHRKAYDQLKTALEVAPNDPAVQRMWFRMLPLKERLRAVEDYLSSPHPDDESETKSLREYSEYLKATVDKPVHACRMISKVEQTQTPLKYLMRDATHLRGFGLQVKLNDHVNNLLLDTGASGIVIGRKAAERAGLERVANQSLGGIGDKGLQEGYLAVAKRIRIGELEFEDCMVSVSDRTSIVDEDGLIGSNVFSSYLVGIDGPGYMLRLSSLPRRPDEVKVATALNTDVEKADEGEDAKTEQDAAKKVELRLPKDRYIAPEMANWSKVFRFGHQLLIPTHVNDSPSMLFVIDTGSFSNMLSTSAARKVSKVYQDDRYTVTGLNGKVNDVYIAEKAKLQFSRFALDNQNAVTIDLSSLSRHNGTEVSGLLGFTLLRLLDMKIDYRDGLVDFSYDPKRLPAFMRE